MKKTSSPSRGGKLGASTSAGEAAAALILIGENAGGNGGKFPP
jgi:hypothetical protein